jgi:hypothetical protein
MDMISLTLAKQLIGVRLMNPGKGLQDLRAIEINEKML